jgi:stage V sporulation protein SpoVS
LSSFEGIEQTIIDRTDSDRRDLSWRTLIFGYLRSRRRTTRRVSEDMPIFTDYHHPWLFFLATGIMMLSCFDAFLTLQLLDRGAIEINPVMAAVINQGTLTFAVTKMLLTSIGILALVFLARATFMRRFRTGLILTFFFSGYSILVCYEFVFLIQQI